MASEPKWQIGAESETLVAACAYCDNTGVDPRGASPCPTCGGSGWNVLDTGTIRPMDDGTDLDDPDDPEDDDPEPDPDKPLGGDQLTVDDVLAADETEAARSRSSDERESVAP